MSSITLEGSTREYTNLDDVPLDALAKLQLARYFYKQCKALCSDLAPIMGYSICPLQTALRMDDASRCVHLRHKDGNYDKDFFLDFIIEKTFPSIGGLRDIQLPHLLDTRWYHIHCKFISHHDFHRANIKLASVLEDFLETKPRTSTVADDDDSFDDDEVTSTAGEGAIDSNQANDYDNPEFSGTK